MVKSSLIFIYLYFASTPALQSSRYARKIKIFRLTWKDKRLYYESFQEIIVSISRWEHTLKTFNHLEKELFINEGREQNKVSNFLIFYSAFCTDLSRIFWQYHRIYVFMLPDTILGSKVSLLLLQSSLLSWIPKVLKWNIVEIKN